MRSGRAIYFASILDFERFLAEHEIAFHGDPDDLDSDLANLEQAL
jgi:hypothetical protein